MTGHICPECGGERSARPGAGCACGAGPDTRPGREARSAEMAAAEDFDPLRIRPYVTLHSEDAQDHGAPDAATTMPLFLDGAPGREPGAHGSAPGARPGATAADENRRRSAAAYAGGGPDPVQPRRRRPFVVVAVGAAVARWWVRRLSRAACSTTGTNARPHSPRPRRACRTWATSLPRPRRSPLRPPPPPHRRGLLPLPLRRRHHLRSRPRRRRARRRRRRPRLRVHRRLPPPRRRTPARHRWRLPPKRCPGRRCDGATAARRWRSSSAGCRRSGCTGAPTTATTPHRWSRPSPSTSGGCRSGTTRRASTGRRPAAPWSHRRAAGDTGPEDASASLLLVRRGRHSSPGPGPGTGRGIGAGLAFRRRFLYRGGTK